MMKISDYIAILLILVFLTTIYDYSHSKIEIAQVNLEKIDTIVTSPILDTALIKLINSETNVFTIPVDPVLNPESFKVRIVLNSGDKYIVQYSWHNSQWWNEGYCDTLAQARELKKNLWESEKGRIKRNNDNKIIKIVE